MTNDNLQAHSQGGGLFERAITRLLMRTARVSDVVAVSDNFRLVTFQSETLREVRWTPGDKIQIKLDGGLTLRTYTPVAWDGERGQTHIVIYCHGDGPGSVWARGASLDEERSLLGPRGSLAIQDAPSSYVLFGDETSFGLAAALSSGATSSMQCVFEVNTAAECRCVLAQLALTRVTVVERRADNSHLSEISAAIQSHLVDAASLVMSGNAQSIQYIRGVLKAKGIDTRRMKTKPYWAPGKVGLD